MINKMILHNKLKSFYKKCDGRMSHFLILREEKKEFIDFCVKENYIHKVKNSSDAPLYTITEKVVSMFSELTELDKKHLQYREEITTLRDDDRSLETQLSVEITKKKLSKL
jgi:oxalate decarboxylase/phosphoglucose isomerase-like protein (cupin superfamily)